MGGSLKVWTIVTLIALISLSFMPVPVNAIYSWNFLGGATSASPAVTGIYGDRVDVVVRGTDNSIYHKYWTSTGGWSNWINLNGKTADTPAVAYTTYPNQESFHVVVRGLNNKIYHKKFDLASNTWDSSWNLIEPAAEPWNTPSTPALVSTYRNGYSCLFLLMRGQDNYLRYVWYDGHYEYWTGYAGKTWLMGLTKDTPAVAAYNDQIHIVVRGMDDGIYHRWGTPESAYIQWNVEGWINLPGSTISAPTLWGDDYYGLHLFVRGSDNALYWWDFTSDTTWFLSLGGATCDRPAFWIEPQSIWRGDWCLVVRGMDNGIYRKYRVWNYDDGEYEWAPVWTYMNGHTLSAPAIDNYCLVVQGTNNGIYMSNSLWG